MRSEKRKEESVSLVQLFTHVAKKAGHSILVLSQRDRLRNIQNYLVQFST
jgi:hypothetical protein